MSYASQKSNGTHRSTQQLQEAHLGAPSENCAVKWSRHKSEACSKNCQMCNSRDSYKKVLMESTIKKRDLYGEFLNSLSILTELDKWERLTVADALEAVNYDDEEVVFAKGDIGKEFFMILEG